VIWLVLFLLFVALLAVVNIRRAARIYRDSYVRRFSIGTGLVRRDVGSVFRSALLLALVLFLLVSIVL
jgi:hypothetical protein